MFICTQPLFSKIGSDRLVSQLYRKLEYACNLAKNCFPILVSVWKCLQYDERSQAKCIILDDIFNHVPATVVKTYLGFMQRHDILNIHFFQEEF